MKKISIALLFVPCVAVAQQMTDDELLALAKRMIPIAQRHCREIGYAPDTPPYHECVLREARQRGDEEIAYQHRREALEAEREHLERMRTIKELKATLPPAPPPTPAPAYSPPQPVYNAWRPPPPPPLPALQPPQSFTCTTIGVPTGTTRCY